MQSKLRFTPSGHHCLGGKLSWPRACSTATSPAWSPTMRRLRVDGVADGLRWHRYTSETLAVADLSSPGRGRVRCSHVLRHRQSCVWICCAALAFHFYTSGVCLSANQSADHSRRSFGLSLLPVRP